MATVDSVTFGLKSACILVFTASFRIGVYLTEGGTNKAQRAGIAQQPAQIWFLPRRLLEDPALAT